MNRLIAVILLIFCLASLVISITSLSLIKGSRLLHSSDHGRKSPIVSSSKKTPIASPAFKSPAVSGQPLLATVKSPTFLPASGKGNQPPSIKTDRMGPPLPQRIYLKQVEESRDGFGFVKNYSSLGLLFAPQYKTDHFLPMIDVRINNINNLCKVNTYGTSLGVVARHIPKSSCWMWGVNTYWDYRQGTLSNWFQMGAGVELLGKTCDFRINGYVPLEGKKTKVHTFEVGEGLYTKRIKYEYPFSGFNAELGWRPVRKKDFQLYLAAGTYYLSGSGCQKNSWGGTFRVRPQYKDFVAIDVQMSEDSIFKLIYKLQVIFSLPLYRPPKKQKAPCGIYEREIYQPVERYDLINLGRGTCWKSNF